MTFLLPLIILIIAVIIRLLPKKHHDIVVDMSYEEMISNLRPFAQSMRSPSMFGAGVSIGQSKRRLIKAYQDISYRVKAGEEIYEFERLIYENYHLIRRLLEKSLYKGYSTLPHKNLNPRIITLAHFIIKGCSRRLSSDRISSIIKAFNRYTPLHFSEISMLKNSLLYMLVRDISFIAAKSTHYNKMKNSAERSSELNLDHYMADSYLYYYSEKWGNPKDLLLIRNSDINTDNIENSFVTALIDNCVGVNSIVDSIRNIDKIIDDEMIVNITPSHQFMLANESYKLMDIDSIKAYLYMVDRISDSLNVSEKAVIAAAFKLEKNNDIHFGEFLFGNNRTLKKYIKYGKDKNVCNLLSNTATLYLATIILIVLACGAAYGMMSSLNIVLRVIIGIMISLALIKPAEHLYSYVVRYEHRFMPRMGYKLIPPEGETMVVISELLSDVTSVHKAFKHLRIISENSRDNNVSYLLLSDLKESNKEIEEYDSEIIDAIKQEYENSDKLRINVLVRKRTKNHNIYSGKERKRGALMELSKYLIEGISDQFIYQSRELRKPQFMILLDADNEILPGTINRAINGMLHPLNNKYDLLTFGCATNMNSVKTYYGKKFIGQCGIPDYGKSSDYIYDISNSSIFCGKGIIRVNNFYNKLKSIFPDNRILSHDIIEGAILTTGAIQDRVYEDAPSNIVSDIERKSRWMRGDYQLIPYIFKNEPASIRPIYRYTIFSNVINALIPFIQLALFIVMLLTSSRLIFIFLLISLLLSTILDIIGILRGLTGVKRGRYVALSIYQIIKNTIARILFLPFNAINGLYLFLLTMTRLLITKRNLLEWKTYSSTQGASKFNKYATMIIPSFIIMTILSYIMIDYLIFLIYTALFMAYSIALFTTGKEIRAQDNLSVDNKETLMLYAEDIYKYFDNFVKSDNNYLAPDNYQVYPFKGDRYSTSPSNIGLSILAFISAAELGIISSSEALLRLNNIIDTLVKLPKWNGHLYNWYNTKTLEVLYPNFVSSVDSANLIASLLVTTQFLKCNKFFETKKKVDELISEVDYKKLYDEDLHLFYIGYNESSGEFSGHYDLIASESRILSYIATAKSCDIIHWMHLSRECVALRGNTLISWSGTAFEYLMPELFLDTPRYSMIGHSVRNVVKEQIKSRIRGLWGISEGGFYRFDEQLNYEYKAFGLRELSLRSDYSRAVVTPYSSFLMLQYNPRAVMNNLSNLKNHGMYGEYGFYEALDLYSAEKPVNSFMAHHLGMSIAAIANYLKSGIIRKYFNNNDSMASVKLVLTEGIITNRYGDIKDDSLIYAKKVDTDTIKFSPIKAQPQHNILTNGAYSVLSDDYGNGYSVYGDIYLNRYRRNADSGIYTYILDKKSNKIITPSYSPIRENLNDYTVTYTSNSSFYHNKVDNFSMEIFVPPCFSGEVRKYNFYNKSEEGREIRIAMYSELNINTMDRDQAHPVFNDMFISTSFLKDRNTIIAKRKNIDGSGYIYSAMVIKGVEDIRVDTDRMSFIGHSNDSSNPNILNKDYNYTGEAIGEVLYPCFGMYTDVPVAPKSNVEFYAAFIINDNYDKLLDAVNEANSIDFVKHAEMSSKVTSVNFYSKCIKVLSNELRTLADYVLNGNYSRKQLIKLGEESTKTLLYSLNIDPFTKYVLLDYKGEANDNLVTQYVGMIKYLSKADIKLKLVIVYNDSDNYYQSTRKHLEDLIYRERGGVIYPILVCRADIDNDKYELLNNLAYAIAGKIKYENVNNSNGVKKLILSVKIYEDDKVTYFTGEGGFTEDGSYIVRPFNNHRTLLPYSNIIAGTKGGTVITSNGGGFTFSRNSREEKISEWNNDPVTDRISEGVYFITRQGQLRINSSASGMSVKHSKGLTRFGGICSDVRIIHDQYMIKDGSIKVYDTVLINSGAMLDIDIVLMIDIAMGWKEDRKYCYYEIVDEKLLNIVNIRNGQRASIRVFDNGKFILDSAKVKPRDTKNNCIFLSKDAAITGNKVCASHYRIRLNKYARLVFMVSADSLALSKYNLDKLDYDKANAIDYFNNLSVINIDSSDKCLDILFNKWLMYQIVSSRINGKCGYYQAGGAIGFRDQLQDCLSLLYSNPEYVRSHILNAAAHQYREGDVMHWWHYERFGVRTKIKDDAMFLVYVTSEYIEATADIAILDEQISYLESKLLDSSEHCRLETPDITSDKESLLSHMLRAIDNTFKLGEHNLILIGGGDWNDALDRVGINNRGESVWLSQFMYMTILKLINYVDNDLRLKLINYAEKLKEAINTYAYDGKWYRRIYTDKGEWLGSKGSDVCKIDLISQAFAVLSGVADRERAEQSINSSLSLVDYENGLIKLLDPPFDDSNWYGYISAYPKGVRENGGQYTHAAIWYIMALFRIGRVDEGYKLLKMINPIEKLRNKENCYKYKGEPYVLPADIYSNINYKGRMGWNFYTGSASWCYKLIVEEIAGIRLINNCLVIKPNLPKELKYINIDYRYKSSTYKIMVNRSDKEAMIIDGVEVANGNTIPLSDNSKICEIIVLIK